MTWNSTDKAWHNNMYFTDVYSETYNKNWFNIAIQIFMRKRGAETIELLIGSFNFEAEISSDLLFVGLRHQDGW